MTKTADRAIAQFVTDVQAALDGLDAVTIGELTESLEADLLDRQAAEGNEFKLGSPAAYAKELMHSAGLAGEGSQPSKVRAFFAAIWNWLWTTIKTARPAWWVLRGLAGYTCIWFVLLKQDRTLPDNASGWLVLLVLVAVSIQLGRVRNKTWWFRAPMAALNILALVTSIYWATAAVEVRNKYEQLSALASSNMLLRGGQPVGFAYAYDKDGNQLPMQTLKAANGEILYETPKPELSDAVLAVQGMTLKAAIQELSRLNVTAVDVQYQYEPGVRSGHVAAVQKIHNSDGTSQVLLTVAN